MTFHTEVVLLYSHITELFGKSDRAVSLQASVPALTYFFFGVSCYCISYCTVVRCSYNTYILLNSLTCTFIKVIGI